MLKINIISCLEDNYSYIVHDTSSDIVGVIDPSEFKPIDNFIKKKFNKINFILNTHHHFDHTGGNLELKKKYNCKIIGSINDEKRIPGIDIKLQNNDIFEFGNIEFKIIFVPGHTSGHICFYSAKEKVIFTGDTLFSLGCGRVFEGTYQQMLESLNKIKNLPKQTSVYCGHEYTKKNLDFCLKIELYNPFLKDKKIWVDLKMSKKEPTIPVTLQDELNTNIFLRCDVPSVKKSLGMKNSLEVEIFKKLRDLKDSF
ncbi:hydroxyacylglutathione hydrolase [Pelagibacteraceae bacterium]|nr:hydroxyacylglutathione hydrolase [Pelagibacteraceae bacterium]